MSQGLSESQGAPVLRVTREFLGFSREESGNPQSQHGLG